MAIHFTPAQQKVLDAREHNLLVSAAAGSGKTAVLVERIVGLISEGEHPLDIDRLLVVTFTRAAAAQMRERIGDALAARLKQDPGNAHLQRQEVLLHNAQITTMDSFFTFLLRNYFSDIDLDPGFRQIDATESRILAADVMQDFLEEKYAGGDPAFLRCASWFCPGPDDSLLESLLLDLCDQAASHPSRTAWLQQRAADYNVPDEAALFSTPWMRSAVLRTAAFLLESADQYEVMKEICLQPGGPDICLDFFEEEQQGIFGALLRDREEIEALLRRDPAEECAADRMGRLWEEILCALKWEYRRFPSTRGKKYAYIDPSLKDAAKSMRDEEKDNLAKLRSRLGGQTPEVILAMMDQVREPLETLSSLAVEFLTRFQEAKKEKHLIDFVDLEHYALAILAERREDGSYVPRRAARSLRSHYAEILIDEYQDSNEVQELMLQIISGEDDGRYNRFMVGDIKQSIYRFRLARPEIFMEKYDSYLPDDPRTERIELDLNFRSRGEVLDCVNEIFLRLMRREVGGVEYNAEVSLKKGAVFPNEETGTGQSRDTGPVPHAVEEGESPYTAELLLLDTQSSGEEEEEENGRGENTDDLSGESPASEEEEESSGALPREINAMTARQREALLIAGRIRELVGTLPVRDEETGQMRPARFGDIVILTRSTVGWNEDLRAVFAREGIPAYAESRSGYFSAEEIRVVIALLRVLDNPRQDIPLYGVLRGYFGDFTQDEIAEIRLTRPGEMLYDALCAAAAADNIPEYDIDGALQAKCLAFLRFLEVWRQKAEYCPVSEIVNGLLEETGYQEYCTALPAGAQRIANLRLLRNQAEAFTKTDFSGLFQFLRYIDGLHRQEIDYGEANILDENADVVRIMSIHKSKGLEFPICFVAGLSKSFSFRHFDASGPVLYDGDWGVGLYYYDPVSRVRATTLRREEISEKIRRDCMGEELRVLYVAMTRAKEKLILTASLQGAERKIGTWKSKMAGFFHREDAFRLSPFMIGGASSFAELIIESILAYEGPDANLLSMASGPSGEAVYDENRQGAPAGIQSDRGLSESNPAGRPLSCRRKSPLKIRLYGTEDLTMQAVEEQFDLSRRGEILRGMEGKPLDAQPDPAAAHRIAGQVFSIYPHEHLHDLYAQTSVSELKHRAMQQALRPMQEEGGAEAESALDLFPDPVPVPYLPAFLAKEEELSGPEDEKEDPAAGSASGARRGTAFHRVLECLDYARRKELLGLSAADLRTWILSLAEQGKLSPEDAGLVSPEKLRTFLESSLAERMADADARRALFREQPFVLGIPADRVPAAGGEPGQPSPLLEKERVMVQGIIDAFFLEEDHVILVDYKTDRVRTPQDLILRYQTQLDLYADALGKAFSLPVKEKILYSTALGREVRLP